MRSTVFKTVQCLQILNLLPQHAPRNKIKFTLAGSTDTHNYNGSLAPADFSGAVFTCAHFQKNAQISSLCDFHYITEAPWKNVFGL